MPDVFDSARSDGLVSGRKLPLTPDQVSLIRLILRQEQALRDLALFDVALDSSFRVSDLVRLRVIDVTTPTGVRELVEIRQKQKETHPAQALLSSSTRHSLGAYLDEAKMPMHGWLFTRQWARPPYPHLSESLVWRLFKSWLEKASLDPSLYGLHSLRLTFPTHVYRETGNLRAAQLLLGDARIEGPKEYIAHKQAEVLEIARQYHL